MSALLAQLQMVLAPWDTDNFSGAEESDDDGDDEEEEDEEGDAALLRDTRADGRVAMAPSRDHQEPASPPPSASVSGASFRRTPGSPTASPKAPHKAASAPPGEGVVFPGGHSHAAVARDEEEEGVPAGPPLQLPAPLVTHRSQLALKRGAAASSSKPPKDTSRTRAPLSASAQSSSLSSSPSHPLVNEQAAHGKSTVPATCVSESSIPVSMFQSEFTLGRREVNTSSEYGTDPSSSGGGGCCACGCHATSNSRSVRRLQRRFSRNTRAALTRVELARAALALFTSNAGAYRPLLQKVLTFLFAYLDFLVEERSNALFTAARAGDSVRSHNGTSRHSQRSATEADSGKDGDNGDVIANAYQKVRLVEARMSALAEEASAQRDRFRAQVATQQQQQEKLEALLRHQMEMNHILVNRPLSMQEEVGGMGEDLDDATRAARMTGAELELYATKRRERDAQYVRRLIVRAEKEKALEELERNVGELTQERAQLNERVTSLLKLNSLYARQTVELVARLSIVRDHNIGLAADAQLYQRDAERDRERGDKLARDLNVARNMLLTLLEVRNREILLGGSVVVGTEPHAAVTEGRNGRPSPPREALLLAAAPDPSLAADTTAPAGHGAPVSPLWVEEGPEGAGPLVKPDNAASPSALPQPPGADTRQVRAAPAAAVAGEWEQVEVAVSRVRDGMLRRQLQEILAVNDAALGGATKSALLSVLCINTGSAAEGGAAAAPATTATEATSAHGRRGGGGGGQIGEPREHLWAPPYGHSSLIPRHLRSSTCVRLLPFHPLVAESFIHELLSQRQDLIHYLTEEAEADALLLATPSTRGAKGDEAVLSLFHTGPPPVSRMLPLDEFTELFVNIVWLNRSERFLPLLPDAIQEKMSKEAGALAGGSSSGGGGGNGGVTDAVDLKRGMWQQQIQYLIHSGRKAPEELLQLPEEGLRLTYSLDVASRRSDAGFLTYAYGLASRRMLSEVIFDVLWQERSVFLGLCEHADGAQVRGIMLAQRERMRRLRAKRKGRDPNEAPASTNEPATADEGDDEQEEEEESQEREGDAALELAQPRGTIPVVQLARILATMFPSYPVTKLEELVLAAIEDGCNDSRNPLTVYYRALLPRRLLPGSTSVSALGTGPSLSEGDGEGEKKRERSKTLPEVSAYLERNAAPPPTASAAAGAFWQEGRFSTLFYKSICDDALEAAQAVQDSVSRYAHNRTAAQAARQQATAETATSPTGSGEPQLSRRASRQPSPQRTSLTGSVGEGAVPTSATIKQLCAFALQGVAPAEERQWGSAVRAALQRWPRLLPEGQARASKVPAGDDDEFGLAAALNAAAAGTHVAIADVPPFLRRNLVLRRGPYPPAKSRAAIEAMLTRQQGERQAAAEEGQSSRRIGRRKGPKKKAPAMGRESRGTDLAAQENPDSEGDDGSDTDEDENTWWGRPQRSYIAALQRRFNRYAPRDAAPLASDLSFFHTELRRLDPDRGLPWATNAVGEDNASVLRCPLSEAEAASRRAKRHRQLNNRAAPSSGVPDIQPTSPYRQAGALASPIPQETSEAHTADAPLPAKTEEAAAEISGRRVEGADRDAATPLPVPPPLDPPRVRDGMLPATARAERPPPLKTKATASTARRSGSSSGTSSKRGSAKPRVK